MSKPLKKRAAFRQSVGVNTYAHSFTRIPYFQLISYVPRDLMHIELEGNLKVHLYGFLYMAIKKYKWFSLGEFNDQIRSFPFLRNTHGNVERPPKIPRTTLKGRAGKLPWGKGSIPFTSGQMLQFVLHSLEIIRPLLSTQALASAEYAAWLECPRSILHSNDGFYLYRCLHCSTRWHDIQSTGAIPGH